MNDYERKKEKELDNLFGIPSDKVAEEEWIDLISAPTKDVQRQLYENMRRIEEEIMSELTEPFIGQLKQILPDDEAVKRVARGLGFLIIRTDPERFQKELCVRGGIPYAFGRPYGGTPKYMHEGTRCWAEWPDELYEERKVWAKKQERRPRNDQA